MTLKEKAVALRKTGKTCREIAKEIGSTVGYVQQVVYTSGLSHAIVSSHPSGKRYNWDDIQKFYDAGNRRMECLEKFSIPPTTWDAAGKDGRLKIRPRISRDDYFNERKYRDGQSLRFHLKKAGHFEHRCAKCLGTEWNGLPIPLEIDHVDGDRLNNKLDNLRFLCPNCHAQTPTYMGKNKGHYTGTSQPGTQEKIREMLDRGCTKAKIATELQCSMGMVDHVVYGERRFRYT